MSFSPIQLGQANCAASRPAVLPKIESDSSSRRDHGMPNSVAPAAVCEYRHGDSIAQQLPEATGETVLPNKLQRTRYAIFQLL